MDLLLKTNIFLSVFEMFLKSILNNATVGKCVINKCLTCEFLLFSSAVVLRLKARQFNQSRVSPCWEEACPVIHQGFVIHIWTQCYRTDFCLLIGSTLISIPAYVRQLLRIIVNKKKYIIFPRLILKRAKLLVRESFSALCLCWK